MSASPKVPTTPGGPPMAVAAAQRMNDLRRLELSGVAAARTGRAGKPGSRPPAPAPPVEVTATELAELKMTLAENTAELKKSQATLKVRAVGCQCGVKCVFSAETADTECLTRYAGPLRRRSGGNASTSRRSCRTCG